MIYNTLDMSTIHITEETARWIDADIVSDRPVLIAYPKNDYGWFIKVPEFAGNEITIDEIPSDLLFLFGMATGAQAPWLVLDCDSDIYEDLPQYEW